MNAKRISFTTIALSALLSLSTDAAWADNHDDTGEEARRRQAAAARALLYAVSLPYTSAPLHQFRYLPGWYYAVMQRGAGQFNAARYQPHPHAWRFSLDKVSGHYNGKPLMFNLPVIAKQSGHILVQVAYDFNGNGRIDRQELYHGVDVPAGRASILHHAGAAGINSNRSYGEFADMVEGRVVVTIWAATGLIKLALQEALIELPFAHGVNVFLQQTQPYSGLLTMQRVPAAPVWLSAGLPRQALCTTLDASCFKEAQTLCHRGENGLNRSA